MLVDIISNTFCTCTVTFQTPCIKNWKKYSNHWLQNFLTVKNFVQLAADLLCMRK